MPITGVYFIPSNPNASTALNTITERLRSAFTDEELIPIGRWVLEHKLMRDTPGCVANPPTKPRYMQFLSLSHYPNHGFIYTSEPPEKPYHPPGGTFSTPSSSQSPTGSYPPPASSPPTTTATPAQSQSNAPGPSDSSPMLMTTVPPSAYGSLFQHFTYACQPFWCHRLTVTVPSGLVYEVGDFRVRIGEVRQTFPVARVRGTVIEIEWRGPSMLDSLSSSRSHTLHSPAIQDPDGDTDTESNIEMFSALQDSDIDAEYIATASLIRQFWARLHVDGAREAILFPGVGTEVKSRLRRLQEKRLRRESLQKENGSMGLVHEDDPDPLAGADVARQFMEVLRFSR